MTGRSTHKNFIGFIVISFLAGCGSGSENIPPQIALRSVAFEGAELSQIAIKSNAIDLDGSIVSHNWVQSSGSPAILENVNSNLLTMTLPDVASDETLNFSVSVADNDGAISSQDFSVFVRSSLADNNPISPVQIAEEDSNLSVFISSLNIEVDPKILSRISFKVTPKVNSVSEAFKVTYEISKLTITDMSVTLPVYGLFSNYDNSVELSFTFTDDSSQNLLIEIPTGVFEDLRNVYNNLQVVKSPEKAYKPTFSYLLLKSAVRGPVIMDVDGNIRWVSGEDYDSSNSTYLDGTFYTTLGPDFIKHTLDDIKSQNPMYQPPEFSEFTGVSTHHNVDKGKSGLLVQITAYKNEVKRIESVLWETDLFGNIIKEWDIGKILESYMIGQGDDPAGFVRHGFDWCHTNSATYQESDDSLLVSCRESFVIKLDYESSEIQWVLGDETKYWYTFPSLRELSLVSLDTKPIGQHSLSIVNGELLLFNNGFFSLRQPDGVSKGLSLDSSRGARYSINAQNKSAELKWEYDPGLYSDVCSSIYKDSSVDGDYLVNFAAINRTNGLTKKVILQGVNENRELLFEYHLLSPEPPCITAWNAEPISDFTNLIIQ